MRATIALLGALTLAGAAHGQAHSSAERPATRAVQPEANRFPLLPSGTPHRSSPNPAAKPPLARASGRGAGGEGRPNPASLPRKQINKSPAPAKPHASPAPKARSTPPSRP
jgi:hypothetical protein